MSLNRINPEDLNGLGVTPLSDVPGLSAEQMKAKFEEIVRTVVIPKFNAAIDALNALLYTDEWGNAYLTNDSLLTSYDSVKANTDATKVPNGIAMKEMDTAIATSFEGVQTAATVLAGRVTHLENDVWVAFMANGGTGSMAQVKRTPDAQDNSITLPDTESFERTGYDFTGWGLAPDGAAVYDLGDTVTGVNDLLVGNVLILYAIWEESQE